MELIKKISDGDLNMMRKDDESEPEVITKVMYDQTNYYYDCKPEEIIDSWNKDLTSGKYFFDIQDNENGTFSITVYHES